MACTVILIATLWVTRLHVTAAHSNLGSPLSYSPVSCKASAAWCDGACPKVQHHGPHKARNSASNPAAEWRRGSEVTIVWHKNNHRGGFYRRSLVPVQHMYNHSWHKRTAFDFGCWSQGVFNCGQNTLCGADKRGRAYRNRITVPPVFPDGDYVFAQVWYGGLHWRRQKPRFSDYFSCSFVRIKGGVDLVSEYNATWTGDKSKCETGSIEPLQCGGESCVSNKVQETVPKEFKTNELTINPPILVDSRQRSLNTRKVDTNPLQYIVVFVDGEKKRFMRNGEVAKVWVGKGNVTFEAFTGQRRPQLVHFKIPGRKTWTERFVPYIYQGNVGTVFEYWQSPIYFKWFNLTVVAVDDDNTTHKLSVRLKLRR